MIEWLIFFGMVLALYLIDISLKSIFLKKDPAITEMNKDIEKILLIKMKSIETQKQYLGLIDKRDSYYGNPFGKLIFIMLMFIVYSILIDYLPIVYFSIAFCIIVPLLYIRNKKQKLYNYLSMFSIFTFMFGYMILQSTMPMTFFGFKVSILIMLPLLLILGLIIKVTQEKIYKEFYARRTKNDENDRIREKQDIKQ